MELKAQGKNIPTYPIGSLFIQGERFADTICITVDRFYGGWDLSECGFVMKGETEAGEIINEVLLFDTYEGELRINWQVSDLFVQNAGRLKLELKAVKTTGSTVECILKYDMQPVLVKPSLTGTNEVLPDTAEQTISQVEQITSNCLAAIRDGLLSVRAEIQNLGLDAVQERLDAMDEKCTVFLSRPEVVALTQSEYNALTPKKDSLYIIIKED